VANVGMAGIHWVLAARVLPLNPGLQYWVVREDNRPNLSLWTTIFESIPEFVGDIPGPGLRFPGPYEVEPDVP